MTSDLSTLLNLDEHKIISVLKDRLNSGQIYTYAGPTLLSLNPNKALPLFCSNTKHAYKHDGCTDPHIYAIAERALYQQNAAIVITGESGSGKTFNFEEILKYYKCNADELKILEYFGNAGTVLNQNSSRFGKRVDLYWDQKVYGIKVTIYMLEKNRVTHGTRNGEKNFHIFYYLCKEKGLNICNDYINTIMPENKESGIYSDEFNSSKMHNEKFNSSKMHNEKFNSSKMDYDESNTFKYIMNVLKKLGLCITTIENYLLGILHLGSITLSDYQSVKTAANLLSFEPESLTNYLKYKIIKTPYDEIKTINNEQQVRERRDTLARQLYESLFEYIVDAINHKLFFDKKINTNFTGRVISLLDIYGFEVFPSNKFDQFCINWANERLHSIFLTQTFENIYNLFDQEDIEYVRVPVKHSLALDAIEKKCGLADLFNEKNLSLDKIQRYMQHDAIKIEKNKLWIKHYADWVDYSINDFEAINAEAKIDYATLLKDIDHEDSLLHKLINKSQTNHPTVLKTFKKSLDSLISFLTNKAIFIRCIKPGSDEKSVYNQLVYSGLFDALSAGNQTHAYSLEKEEFDRLYQVVDRSGVIYGKTKVFFSNEIYKRLERERAEIVRNGKMIVRNIILLEYLKKMYNKKENNGDLTKSNDKSNFETKPGEDKLDKTIKPSQSLKDLPLENNLNKSKYVSLFNKVNPKHLMKDGQSIDSDDRFDMVDFNYAFPSENKVSIGSNEQYYEKGGDCEMDKKPCVNCTAVEIKYKYQCEEVKKVKEYKNKILHQQNEIELLKNEVMSLKEAQKKQTLTALEEQTRKLNFMNEKTKEIENNSETQEIKDLHGNINDAFYFDSKNRITFSSPYDVFGCLIEVFLDFYPKPLNALPVIEIKGFSHIILHAVLKLGISPASALNMFTNQLKERYKLFEKNTQKVLYILTNIIEIRLLINGNEERFSSQLHEACQEMDEIVNVLFLHVSELFKHLLTKDLMAVVENQGIREFICPSGYFTRFFSKPAMNKFIEAFDHSIYLLDFYCIPEQMKIDMLTHLLRFINVRCFNYVLTKQNFLSFNRGIQINNNLNEIEKLLRNWGYIDLVFILGHLRDIIKLINLVAIGTPIEGIIDTCCYLSDTHIAELIVRFTNKEKETIRKDVKEFKIKPGIKFIEVGQLKCEFGGMSELVWIVPRYVPAKYVHSIIGSLPVNAKIP